LSITQKYDNKKPMAAILTRGTAGRRSPALIHKWNNLTVRYAGLIPPHIPIILIEPKHIWNTTFRLIILGKLDGPRYTTNVHIFILGSCNVQFHELLINHVGEFAMTKCILNCLKISKFKEA
jgi:hypothetical protein